MYLSLFDILKKWAIARHVNITLVMIQDVRLEISVKKGQVHQVLTTAASRRKLPGENR